MNKKIINFIINIILRLFLFKKLLPFYKLLLHFSLKANGYKNFGAFKLTGEEYFLKKIKKFKIKNSLDIGANHGEYSKKIIQKTNSNVLAFEIMKDSFFRLKLLEKEYNQRIKCFNIGLSDKIENKYIYFQDKTSQLASLEKNINKLNYLKKNIKKKKVQLTTLDRFVSNQKSYFKNGIDFIKIDTEGSDYKILLGSVNVIKKYRPKFIQFEMNWHYLFSGINVFKIAQKFKDYKIYKIMPYNFGIIQINPSHPDNNFFHLSNFVLIRKDVNFK